MSSGRIVSISAIVAALTSAGTFFAMRQMFGAAATVPAAVSAAATPSAATPTPAPSVPAPSPEGRPLSAAAAAPAAATPDKGTEPAPATTVAVTVSATVTVPKVSGKRVAAARRALTQAKLRARVGYRYDEDFSEGRVLSQHPAAGSKVAVGSSVKIIVNRDD